MKISSKLYLSFGVVSLIIVAFVIFAPMQMNSLSTYLEQFKDEQLVKVVLLNEIKENQNVIARAIRNMYLTDDTQIVEKEWNRVLESRKNLGQLIEKLSKMVTNEKEKEYLGNLKEVRQKNIDGQNKLFELRKQNKTKEAVDFLFGEFRDLQNKYLGNVSNFLKEELELANQAVENGKDLSATSRNLMIAIGLIGIVLGVAFSTVISRNISKPIKKAVNASERISKGDTNVDLETKSKDETAMLMNAMRKMVENISAMVEDVKFLAKSAQEGKLDVRADASKYEGDFRELVEGINGTLDAVIGPLNVAAEYVDRISKGDIPPKITDEYKGDFNEIKNNLNQLIDGMHGFEKIVEVMEFIAVNDYTKKVSGNYQGIFKKSAEATNNIVDRLLTLQDIAVCVAKGDFHWLEELYKLPSRSENDKMRPSLISMMENILKVIDETVQLANAAYEGKLDYRADESKLEGEYKKILIKLNKALDSLISPLNVAAEYIDRISKGDIPPKITDEYKGDFNEIKNNLNQLIDSLNNVANIATNVARGNLNIEINERSKEDHLMIALKTMRDRIITLVNNIYSIVDEAKRGNLGYRLEVGENKGDFLRLINGINDTLDVFGNIFDFAGNFMIADSQGYINYLNKSQVEFLTKYESDYRKNYPDFSVASVLGTHIDRWHKNPSKNRSILENLRSTHKAKINIGDQIMHLIINPLFDKNQNKFGYVVQCNNYTNEANLEKSLDNIVNNVLNGNLDVQIEEKIFTDSYIKIAEKINQMLQIISRQISLSSNYLGLIAKGEIPDKITETFKGEFEKLKVNWNLLIDAINNVVDDSLKLGKALAEGNLDFRADASKHQGVFKQIIETINKATDNIAEPLQETGNVMNFMKDGDLTVRMLGQYAGELQRLKENINIMADSISNLLLQISGSADVTASAAAEISAIAETLAASAAENSAQVDEIATAIEEMSRTISENALGATRAAEMAERNKQIAIEGGNAVQQTVNKMSEIASVVRASAEKIEKLGESSKQIGEIISVIDEIADQTNLLALNAAIEAARAGEQGRGFAVVADEVRKLAERTTEATKQIANMIKGIQKETDEAVRAMKQGTEEVNSGIVLADKAGNSLKEILQSSQEVWDMINQIAAATEEQSSTAEQVAKNVSSISQVTSDTANRVQDIAKSAEDLAKQTDMLRTLLERFKLRKEGETSYLEGKEAKKLGTKGNRFLGSGGN
ncbi:HAMP domain-containing protein [Bacteroidetes/Chlorobi group bacterium Naka2016]|jgi:methyl-accepting chemotaxis protein|nr:MAG: HAMP domain-containing protein [Bacteroidetes/Chlorobi group bacterium Naka2016]